jgi:hypothetical protein
MRSLLRSDSVLGLLVAAALVALCAWFVGVCNRHAKEHGHCVPFPALDVEGAQGGHGDQGGEGQDGCHAGHLAPARAGAA